MITNDLYQTSIYSGLSIWTVSIVAISQVPNLHFTLDSERPEFTLPESPEITLEN